MSASLTDEKVISTLREVVAERPEYIYSCPTHMQEDPAQADPSCFYVHTDEDGSPVSAGCAIGVVLHRLGVPLETLVKEEGARAYGVVQRLFPNLSAKTYRRLGDMQQYQDDRVPWGLAYAKATGETI